METAKKAIQNKLMRWVVSLFGASGLLITFGAGIAVLVILSAVSGQQSVSASQSLPPAVEAYRGQIQSIFAKHSLGEYVDLGLAIMAYESAGVGTDPMNSSESIFNTKYVQMPGGILDPLYSIEIAAQTLQYLKDLAKIQGPEDIEKIRLVVQAYNFGGSYIEWALAHRDGGYTINNAQEFSDMRAAEFKIPVYGDVSYVPNVLAYYRSQSSGELGGGISGTGQLIWPVPGFPGMSRGYGTQPNGEFHRGIDVTQGGILGASIVAADGGVIEIASYGHWSYGNYIQINHQNGCKTLYAHCLGLTAFAGQYVSPGQTIAFVGSTGVSTGAHLHFEVMQGGFLVDPLSVL